VHRVREVYAEAIGSNRSVSGRWTWRERLAQTTTFALVSAFRAVPHKAKAAPTAISRPALA
jgi:hypothetical protein